MGTTKLKLVIFVSKIKDRSADSLSSIFSTKGSDQKLTQGERKEWGVRGRSVDRTNQKLVWEKKPRIC